MTKKVLAAAFLVVGMTAGAVASTRSSNPVVGSVVCMNLAKAKTAVTTIDNKIVQYTVSPGGNPGDIELQFEGASRVYMDLSGRLVLSMDNGEFRTFSAQFYQMVSGKKKLVSGNFRVIGANKAAFQVGKYDTSLPLEIESVIANKSISRG